MPTDLIENEPFSLGDVPADILAVWVVLSVAMLGYWYMRFRKCGVLTFDVFFIGLYLYLPIVGMSILAYSPLNSFATGDWHWRYMPHLREAFYVSLIGAAAFLLSAAVASRWDTAPRGYRLVYRAIHDFWGTRQGLALLVSLILGLGAVTVATSGVVGARDTYMEHTEFRPVAHLFSCFAVIGIYVSLIEGYCRRSWRLTGLGVLLTVLMLGFGTRKVTVGTLLYYGAVRLINSRTRRVVFTAACSVTAIAGLIVMALAVEAGRQKEVSSDRLTAAPSYLLFGNNLSELRDFAWMLAAWDREPLLGKTYASGLLSWIPTFLLPDRKEMSWGLFSTRMTGLEGGGHPGLRPTVFAEAYFNFDLVGVLVFGLLLGAVFGRTAAFAQWTMQLSDRRERAFRLLCAFLYFEFFLRFQQSANYFQSCIELGLLMIGLNGATALVRWRHGTGSRAAAARGLRVSLQAPGN